MPLKQHLFFFLSSLLDISSLRKFGIVFLTENYVAFKQMYLIIALHLCFNCVCTWVKCRHGYVKGMGWAGPCEEQRKPREGTGHLALLLPPQLKKKVNETRPG